MSPFRSNHDPGATSCLCTYWTERLEEARQALSVAQSPRSRDALKASIQSYEALTRSCEELAHLNSARRVSQAPDHLFNWWQQPCLAGGQWSGAASR